jgi:hypothetical protein
MRFIADRLGFTISDTGDNPGGRGAAIAPETPEITAICAGYPGAARKTAPGHGKRDGNGPVCAGGEGRRGGIFLR